MLPAHLPHYSLLPRVLFHALRCIDAGHKVVLMLDGKNEHCCV